MSASRMSEMMSSARAAGTCGDFGRSQRPDSDCLLDSFGRPLFEPFQALVLFRPPLSLSHDGRLCFSHSPPIGSAFAMVIPLQSLCMEGHYLQHLNHEHNHFRS